MSKRCEFWLPTRVVSLTSGKVHWSPPDVYYAVRCFLGFHMMGRTRDPNVTGCVMCGRVWKRES